MRSLECQVILLLVMVDIDHGRLVVMVGGSEDVRNRVEKWGIVGRKGNKVEKKKRGGWGRDEGWVKEKEVWRKKEKKILRAGFEPATYGFLWIPYTTTVHRSTN